MTIFTHEVVITFDDGSTKTIHTYCPESWDTLEKVKQSPIRKVPVSVTVRERTAREIAEELQNESDT